MKTFKQYLMEKMVMGPSHNIGRVSMPQINNHKEFITWLRGRNIDMTLSTVSINSLLPTQVDYDEDKVNRMVSDGFSYKKVIIVSEDLRILDGHHRYFAIAQSGYEDVRVLIVYKNITDLLALAYEYKEQNPDG